MAKRKREIAKQEMPKEKIKFNLDGPISIELMHDFDRYSNGHMMMAITDATVSENGKEIGKIRGGAAAPVLQVIIGRRSWLVSSEDIFAAVRDADKKYVDHARKG